MSQCSAFVCAECGWNFSSRWNLDRHKKGASCKPPRDKFARKGALHVCDTCNGKFMTKHNLLYHRINACKRAAEPAANSEQKTLLPPADKQKDIPTSSEINAPSMETLLEMAKKPIKTVETKTPTFSKPCKTGYNKPPIQLGYYTDASGQKIAYIMSGGPAHSAAASEDAQAAIQKLTGAAANNVAGNNNATGNVSTTTTAVDASSTVVDARTTSTFSPVMINVFGEEKSDHITPRTILKILEAQGKVKDSDLLAASGDVIGRVALLLYNNSSYLENMSVFSAAKKSDQVIVKDRTCWAIRSLESAMSAMAQGSMDQIFDKQPSPGEYGVAYDQNFENIAPILRYMANNEPALRLVPPASLRLIPAANRAMLKAKLSTLPRVGDPA